MFEILGVAAGVGVPIVSAIVWLVRLEGRINSNKQAIGEVVKDLAAMGNTVTALQAQTAADTKAHEETKIALVRVQEQLKHLTDLFERHLMNAATPRRRATEL